MVLFVNGSLLHTLQRARGHLDQSQGVDRGAHSPRRVPDPQVQPTAPQESAADAYPPQRVGQPRCLVLTRMQPSRPLSFICLKRPKLNRQPVSNAPQNDRHRHPAWPWWRGRTRELEAARRQATAGPSTRSLWRATPSSRSAVTRQQQNHVSNGASCASAVDGCGVVCWGARLDRRRRPRAARSIDCVRVRVPMSAGLQAKPASRCVGRATPDIHHYRTNTRR